MTEFLDNLLAAIVALKWVLLVTIGLPCSALFLARFYDRFSN
jgi:hypothetical protein